MQCGAVVQCWGGDRKSICPRNFYYHCAGTCVRGVAPDKGTAGLIFTFTGCHQRKVVQGRVPPENVNVKVTEEHDAHLEGAPDYSEIFFPNIFNR